jgi:hypothetical protein
VAVTVQPTPAPKAEPTPEETAARKRKLKELAAQHAAKLAPSLSAEEFAKLPFSEAAEIWLKSQEPVLSALTFRGYKQCVKWLNRHFADVRLRDIHIGHILCYAEQRTENSENQWTKKAGPSCVNHEVSVLQQIMRRAQLWEKNIGKLYKPLPLPPFEMPKVLSDIEKMRVFAVAEKDPSWALLARVSEGLQALRHTGVLS